VINLVVTIAHLHREEVVPLLRPRWAAKVPAAGQTQPAEHRKLLDAWLVSGMKAEGAIWGIPRYGLEGETRSWGQCAMRHREPAMR
jgi:hypothetical protein